MLRRGSPRSVVCPAAAKNFAHKLALRRYDAVTARRIKHIEGTCSKNPSQRTLRFPIKGFGTVRPTKEFFRIPANRQMRLEGRVQHSRCRYDNDVRQMGRNLWAKHIGSQAGKSARLTCVG